MNEISDEEMEVEAQICRIKLNSKLQKRAPALIADFDHSRVNSNRSDGLKFVSFKSADDINKPPNEAKRTLSARSDHTQYEGCTSKESGHFRTFVGVLNKANGKMKLYDSVLFRMKPVVKVPEADLADQIPTQKTYRESMNTLTENFGLKSSKRALNERQKWAQDPSELEDKLNLADLSLDSSTIESTISTIESKDIEYLPTKNKEAISADQVYDLDEIITPPEQHCLEAIAQNLLNASDEELRSGLCKYVLYHLDNQAVSLEKTKLLIYFDYLVKFSHLKYADIKKKDPVPDIPQPFKQRILETFTQESKTANGRFTRSFSQQMKVKLYAYIILLALFIDDFVVNSTQILNDLSNVGLPKFVSIAQAIGCHIKVQKYGDETYKVAELKMPLYVVQKKHFKKSRA